jgi:hypothetical protein
MATELYLITLHHSMAFMLNQTVKELKPIKLKAMNTFTSFVARIIIKQFRYMPEQGQMFPGS